jgi:hypothetical protein
MTAALLLEDGGGSGLLLLLKDEGRVTHPPQNKNKT